MILASFAELNPFNMRSSLARTLGNEYLAAQHCMYHNKLWYETVHNFMEGLVSRCNMPKHRDLSMACNRQAFLSDSKSSLSCFAGKFTGRDPYIVKLRNLMEAVIVSQFGARCYPDITIPQDIENRFMQVCECAYSFLIYCRGLEFEF